MAVDSNFLAGVIEGFYGQPWSQAERFQLFDWMSEWGLNTYFYAPKDDLKHRALWREVYTEEESETLRILIARCRAKGLRFIYGIGPGLDIHYSHDAEIARLKVRFDQLQELGCRDFALLFDDIPDRMDSEDRERFGSFAKAQCHVANTLFGFLKENSRFLFCPTPYCGRMAAAKLGGEKYLLTVGEMLAREIDVFWTGREIISRHVTEEHSREMQRLLRRKPVLWDNLHANDYDGRRFFVGPYSGRPLGLRDEVGGILLNPNCEFVLNYVPIRTFARYLRGSDDDARTLYKLAMREWFKEFSLVSGLISFEDFLLFGDCFYLPHQDGAEAERLFGSIKQSVLVHREIPEIGRLRECCARLAELRNRPLFYALSRRIWELREELDLLEKFIAHMGEEFRSDFHLPKTYRGGYVARLQTLLEQMSDGTFQA